MTRPAYPDHDVIERLGWPEEFVCLTHLTPLVLGFCEACDHDLAERQFERSQDV